MTSLTIDQKEEQLVVDSRLVAEELGIDHKPFIRTIRKYQSEFEEMGQLIFENTTVTNSVGAVNQAIFCWLNEEQATYAMTLSRNTEKVRMCKRNLVKAFSEAKRQLEAQKQPQTYLEALKALVASEEEKERLRLEQESLKEENQELATAVDELFDYSSIIRIAKYNGISETNYSWRVLKQATKKMGLEVKKVPCPRFGDKNLYPHDAWRYCYPDSQLPETTTLKLR